MTRECKLDSCFWTLPLWKKRVEFSMLYRNFKAMGSESEKARFLRYFFPAWRKCEKMQIFTTKEEFLLNFHYAKCCKIEIYVKSVEARYIEWKTATYLFTILPIIAHFYIKHNELFLIRLATTLNEFSETFLMLANGSWRTFQKKVASSKVWPVERLLIKNERNLEQFI